MLKTTMIFSLFCSSRKEETLESEGFRWFLLSSPLAVRLPIPGDPGRLLRVYEHSYLGYGLVAARAKMMQVICFGGGIEVG